MRCPSCRRPMLSTSSQAIEDDQGAMTITRWRCRPCHETAEEIWLSARYRGPTPRIFRYSVAPSRQRVIPVHAVDERRKDMWTYAGTC
jgi:transposase-like protein